LFFILKGDLVAQKFVEKTEFKKIDWVRTSRFAGIGFFIGVGSIYSS
jgi:hypothetical protein